MRQSSELSISGTELPEQKRHQGSDCVHHRQCSQHPQRTMAACRRRTEAASTEYWQTTCLHQTSACCTVLAMTDNSTPCNGAIPGGYESSVESCYHEKQHSKKSQTPEHHATTTGKSGSMHACLAWGEPESGMPRCLHSTAHGTTHAPNAHTKASRVCKEHTQQEPRSCNSMQATQKGKKRNQKEGQLAGNPSPSTTQCVQANGMDAPHQHSSQHDARQTAPHVPRPPALPAKRSKLWAHTCTTSTRPTVLSSSLHCRCCRLTCANRPSSQQHARCRASASVSVGYQVPMRLLALSTSFCRASCCCSRPSSAATSCTKLGLTSASGCQHCSAREA